MKKLISVLLCIIILLSAVPIMALAAEQVIYGDYVVIVNTNPDTNSKESTGVIKFDSSNSGDSAFDEPLSEVSSDLALIPPTTGTAYGVSKTYSVGNTISLKGMNYTCIAVGSKCYVWMENSLKQGYDSAGKTATAAQDIILTYEGNPYDNLNTLANGKIKYMDNSGKLSILLENDPQSTASGYYAMEPNITAIHITCPVASSYSSGALETRNGLFTHEGQHSLFHLLCADGNAINGYRWFNEGLSVAAMEWTWGQQSVSNWLSYIEGSSDIKKGSALVYNNYRNKTALDYSLPYLYVRYLANRYSQKYAPLAFMQKVYGVKIFKSNGAMKTAEEFLNDVFVATGMKNPDGTALTFRQSLVDFYVAAVKQDRSGIYSFYGDTTVKNSVKNYPVYMGASGTSVSLDGTAAIVVKTKNGAFTVPSNHGANIKFVAVNKVADPFKPEGEGTGESPFLIRTPGELVCGIDHYPNSTFVLMNDIDLSKTSYGSVTAFSGVLHGNGYTLSGVTKALIYQNTGTVKNLNILGAANGEYYGVTSLLVQKNDGYVQDCNVSGTFSPRVAGRGLQNAPTFGAVVAENSSVGTIERCSNTANITLKIDANTFYDTVVGGIVGKNSGTVRDCYSAGSLNVTRVGNTTKGYFVGGIAGVAGGGLSNPFYRCYSVADITDNGSAGSQNVRIGRFAGSFSGYVYTESCYSLDGMTAVGYMASNAMAVNEKTQAQLKARDTFVSWNFNVIWNLPANSYPVFASADAVRTVEAVGTANIFVGEKISYLCLINIKIKINGDSNNLIAISEDMIDKTTVDTSTPGAKTALCSYRGCSFTLNVNVNEPVSTSDLTVYKTGKTAYTVGSVYDDSEVALKVKINGAAHFTTIYSGFTNNKRSPLTLSDTSVTYTYYSSTVSQGIEVKDFALSLIEVVSTPDKSSYSTGEHLDTNNLGVRLNYNDGSTTATMEFEDLQAYGVHLAQKLSNGIWKNFDISTSLSNADSGSTFYLYYGDVLPSDYNDVIRSTVVTVTVQTRLSLPDQEVVLKLGKAYDFTETAPLMGSGYVDIQLVSGTLPANVSVSVPNQAGNEYNCFYFSTNQTGVTGTVKDYPLVYKVQSRSTGQVIYVNITIQVRNKSDVTAFEYVRLRKEANPGKLQEDVYGVIDSQNSTVTLNVPHGTPKVLFLEYKVADGGSAFESNGNWFFNGEYDFAAQSTIYCYIESETGKRKNYTIYFVELPEEEIKLIPTDNLTTVIDYENKLIYGLAPGLSTLADFVEVQGKGCVMNTVKSGNYIGTGSVVEIRKNTAVMDSYTVVIFGDLDGDGWYDGQDSIFVDLLANGILSEATLGKAKYTAADCNRDGAIDNSDVALLNYAGLLLAEIQQTYPTAQTDSSEQEYFCLIEQGAVAETPVEPVEEESESVLIQIWKLLCLVLSKILSIFGF